MSQLIRNNVSQEAILIETSNFYKFSKSTNLNVGNIMELIDELNNSKEMFLFDTNLVNYNQDCNILYYNFSMSKSLLFYVMITF